MINARVLLALWVAAAIAAGAVARDYRVVGSDLLGGAFERALDDFARQSGIAVAHSLRGTRPAIEQMRTGAADVALVALPPGELPPGDPLVARVFAYHAVAVVVPATSPLHQITLGQLRAAFGVSAKENITTWGELGLSGPERSRALALHAPAPNTGLTLPLFRRLLLSDGMVKPSVTLAATLAQLEAAVRQADHALALAPSVPSEGSGVRAVSVANTVSDPAYALTAENLHQGNYTLRLPVYLLFRRDLTPELLPLLRFLLSEDAAEALARAHVTAAPLSARNQLVFDLEELR